jgi:hypothetical protein
LYLTGIIKEWGCFARQKTYSTINHRITRLPAGLLGGKNHEKNIGRREKLRLMAKEKKARKEKRVAIDSLPRSFHGVTRIAKEFCFCDIPCFSVLFRGGTNFAFNLL